MIGLVLALAVATQPPLRPDATLTPGVNVRRRHAG